MTKLHAEQLVKCEFAIGSIKTHCNIAGLVPKPQNQIVQEKIPNRVVALHVAGVMPIVQASQIDEPLISFPRMSAHVQPNVNVIRKSQHTVRNTVRHQKGADVPRSAEKGRRQQRKHIAELVVQFCRLVHASQKLGGCEMPSEQRRDKKRPIVDAVNSPG